MAIRQAPVDRKARKQVDLQFMPTENSSSHSVHPTCWVPCGFIKNAEHHSKHVSTFHVRVHEQESLFACLDRVKLTFDTVRCACRHTLRTFNDKKTCTTSESTRF